MFRKRTIAYLLTSICIWTFTTIQAEAVFAKSKVSEVSLAADIRVNTNAYSTSTKRQAIIHSARNLIGTPYIWGGNDLSGFDCSGFIEYIFKANGLYMPRTTNQQQYFGQPIDLDNVQPGDLYFFEEDDQVYHVALALGEGYYLHAPSPGKSVSYGHVDRFAPQFANRVVMA
ncbi:C40 family peptidase [Aerococcaceae bacterium 50-4]